MKSLFKSAELSQQFDRNGYVVLPFLSHQDLEELSAMFEKYAPRLGQYSIYSNLEDKDKGTNFEIENTIRKLFQPSIQKHFHNYKFFGGSYLVKGTGENSATELHQDWNAVDENKDTSLTVWVPLEDVNEQNGCLQVIPGSHKWFSTIRAANISSLYLKFDPRVEPRVTSVPIKAGTAVIFAFNLFHGSKPNRSNHVRKAVHLAMANDDAELIHYVRATDTKKILKVACEKDFLYSQVFNLLKGVIPSDLNVMEEFPDDNTFTLNEEIFFRKLNAN
jgi:hypothetical protein